VRWLAGVTPSPDEALAIADASGAGGSVGALSLFLTALAQSGVATAGYLIARVPHAVFFGLLTFVAAFIPSIGTTIVALPVALLMLATWHPGRRSSWPYGTPDRGPDRQRGEAALDQGRRASTRRCFSSR